MHGCNIRIGTYKGRVNGGKGWEQEGGNRALVRKKTPRGTPMYLQPYDKQATTPVTNHNRR